LEEPTQHLSLEDIMELAGSTALVTGANRGLGRHLAEQLIARGAAVYAAARNPESVDLPGAIPITLDITDPASVEAAAKATGNVTVLINNAGSLIGGSFLQSPIQDIRYEMETHYFGTLAVTRAFAPQLAAAGTSAVLNVLSVMSWYTSPEMSAYSAAKSAQWSLTSALRLELASQGTQVSALHVGYMDTDMAAHVEADKNDPATVAQLALEGVEAGQIEILADSWSANIRAGLAAGASALYPQFA
jgi:NAD(P)-dependent dehydrogenase (short-subunit alcohol dehydrogenase family)